MSEWANDQPESLTVGLINAGHVTLDPAGLHAYGTDGVTPVLDFENATGSIGIVIGNPAAQHVYIGQNDGHGADGVRLYANDGVTPLIDLNVSGTPTITGALIRTASSGQRVELSATASQLISFYSGNALETAPGFIGSTVLGGILYTQVAGPKAGTAAPPQLQLYNSGTVQAAQLTAPAGQAALLSAGWTLLWDGTGAHNQLSVPGIISLTQAVNSANARSIQLNDQGGTPRGEVAVAGGGGWYTTDAVLNDLIIHANGGRMLFQAATAYTSSQLILDATTGVMHLVAAQPGVDGAQICSLLSTGDDMGVDIGKSAGLTSRLAQITLPGGYNPSAAVGDFYVRTGGSAGRVLINNSLGNFAPVLASAFTVSSAREAKTGVAAQQEGLAEVLRLRPVTYRYRDDASGHDRAGLIAEELAEVFPYAVHHHPDTSRPAGIDYGALAPLLIRAIQELAATRPARSLIDLDHAA